MFHHSKPIDAVPAAIAFFAAISTPMSRSRPPILRLRRSAGASDSDEILVEKRTGYLAMLGNVATLVGLLGTIIGLIDSFSGVAGVDASTKATLLAKGISEAMTCTAFGLLTAVPALLAFAMLNGWTQRILDDINEVSVKVVNLVIGHRNAMKAA